MRMFMVRPCENLSYSKTGAVTVSEFVNVLRRSGLSARRPIEDAACLEGMLHNSNLIVSCWHREELIGIARSVTDFHYCCYLSDLAVDRAYQGRGIGTTLVRMTQEALGPRGQIILLSAPAAVEYYPRIGFEHHPQAWVLPREMVAGRKP